MEFTSEELKIITDTDFLLTKAKVTDKINHLKRFLKYADMPVANRYLGYVSTLDAAERKSLFSGTSFGNRVKYRRYEPGTLRVSYGSSLYQRRVGRPYYTDTNEKK